MKNLTSLPQNFPPPQRGLRREKKFLFEVGSFSDSAEHQTTPEANTSNQTLVTVTPKEKFAQITEQISSLPKDKQNTAWSLINRIVKRRLDFDQDGSGKLNREEFQNFAKRLDAALLFVINEEDKTPGVAQASSQKEPPPASKQNDKNPAPTVAKTNRQKLQLDLSQIHTNPNLASGFKFLSQEQLETMVGTKWKDGPNLYTITKGISQNSSLSAKKATTNAYQSLMPQGKASIYGMMIAGRKTFKTPENKHQTFVLTQIPLSNFA